MPPVTTTRTSTKNRQNNNYSASASCFFVQFFAITARVQQEMPNFTFMEDINKRLLNFLSLSELEYGS